MFVSRAVIWKQAPFIRFLLPLVAGITIEWYLQFTVGIGWCTLVFSVVLFLLPLSLSQFRRFQLSAISGVGVLALFFSLGSLLVWYQDIRHDPGWFAKRYSSGDGLIALLREPPVEKINSFKAVAAIKAIDNGNQLFSVTGNVIVYFEKDITLRKLDVGSAIFFSKPVHEIKSAANPGGFNYKNYTLFQGITHQTYLKSKEFIILKPIRARIPAKILFSIRRKVLSIIGRYIPGEKEHGLAEALLIGYKDGLDKDLVQSYTNTGVVHVIAISGLHLGLIYWLLVQLFRPLRRWKIFRWFTPLMTIAGLWLFSLVAGGQPSVLRSAVMFTCIVLAESFSRKGSIYNSLAFSAFVLLCVNPYWLWDVGFQLSYSAVLSIVIFMRPVYNWFYIKNKILDLVWKLNAVSLAAQLLTTPFSIYHFHQFPNYFLLANFVAVPLSSVIVLGEILLCATAFLPIICSALGRILSLLISLMNSYIQRIESIPYSLWEGMQISVTQATFLLVAVGSFAFWLMERRKEGAWAALFALLSFFFLRSVSFYQSDRQQKFIVYNIPKHQAIDAIEGTGYIFIGDSDLLVNTFIENFHLKPSRVLHRVKPREQLPHFFRDENFLQFGVKRILIADEHLAVNPCAARIRVDIMVVTKNRKLDLFKLSKTFDIQKVIFDASLSTRKIDTWEKDCDSLRIPYYNVNEKGAFVMNLN